MSFDDDYWKQNHSGLQQQHIQVLGMISHKWKLKVLDVGCGDGTFLEQLPKEWKPRGLENSEEAFFKCKKKGLNVERGDMHESNGKTQYDLVTMLDVLEHTLTPEKALKETKKHTSTVILTVPNMAFVKERVYALLGLTPPELKPKKGHCQYITQKRIEQIIKDSGYEIVSTNHYYMKGLPHILPSLFATMFCYKINKITRGGV